MTLREFLKGIADAIRTVEGSTGYIPASSFRPRILALSNGSGGGGGGGDKTTVSISAELLEVSTSVTVEDYYGFYSYNGARLPRIPRSYAYAFIVYYIPTKQYQMLLSSSKWYFDGTRVTNSSSASEPYYRCIEGDTEWTAGTSGNYGQTMDSNRYIVWSNNDIPNGSASATDIYFEGTVAYPIA